MDAGMCMAISNVAMMCFLQHKFGYHVQRDASGAWILSRKDIDAISIGELLLMLFVPLQYHLHQHTKSFT